MKRTTSHRVRYPINDVLIVNKGRWYKTCCVVFGLIVAYTIGSLHVFTSYAPPSGVCTVTSYVPPELKVVSLPADKIEAISEQVSERWAVDRDFAKEVVNTAAALSRRDFPKVEDVLAIVAVESGFNPKAENSGAYGLMQIQYNHHKQRIPSKGDLLDPHHNLKVGTQILREYFEGVSRNTDKAVLAYQAGIGGLLNGEGKMDYLQKFKREQAWFRSRI